MLSYRRFEKLDHDTFGGAEDFEDGHGPIIADVDFEGTPGAIVLGGNGGSAFVGHDEGAMEIRWCGGEGLLHLEALLLLEDMEKVMDLDDLEGLGFDVHEALEKQGE